MPKKSAKCSQVFARLLHVCHPQIAMSDDFSHLTILALGEGRRLTKLSRESESTKMVDSIKPPEAGSLLSPRAFKKLAYKSWAYLTKSKNSRGVTYIPCFWEVCLGSSRAFKKLPPCSQRDSFQSKWGSSGWTCHSHFGHKSWALSAGPVPRHGEHPQGDFGVQEPSRIQFLLLHQFLMSHLTWNFAVRTP